MVLPNFKENLEKYAKLLVANGINVQPGHTVALNMAKIMCKELGTSIGRLKAKMINAYYAQRIIDLSRKVRTCR